MLSYFLCVFDVLWFHIMCLDVFLLVYPYSILIVFCEFEVYAFCQFWKLKKYYIEYCLFHIIFPSGNAIYSFIYAFHKYFLSTYFLLGIGDIIKNEADKNHCPHTLRILLFYPPCLLIFCVSISVWYIMFSFPQLYIPIHWVLFSVVSYPLFHSFVEFFIFRSFICFFLTSFCSFLKRYGLCS